MCQAEGSVEGSVAHLVAAMDGGVEEMGQQYSLQTTRY